MGVPLSSWRQAAGIEHRYLAERRLAMNAWADLLVRLDKGETGKVVPIRNTAA